MPWRRKYLYLANVLLVIAIFSIPAAAQDKNIWHEYRPSIIVAMPINEKCDRCGNITFSFTHRKRN